MSSEKSALVLGATGAVGKVLLRDLLKSGYFKSVTTAGRREVAYDGPNKESLIQKIIDFENLNEHKDAFIGYDTVFCTLGTTRAQAGSAENFIKIDKDYVLDSAKLIKEQNQDKEIHYLYCSSKGSNAHSSFLYLKTKGEIEVGLRGLGFKRVSIFRPGSLKVTEPRDHRRKLEEVSAKFIDILEMVMPKKISVHVDIVGRAIRKVATDEAKIGSTSTSTSENGTIYEVYDHMRIHEIGETSDPE